MSQRLEGDLERIEVDASVAFDDMNLDLADQPLFLELAGDQIGRERGGIERHLEIGREIGNRADMVLMPVGQDDADQFLAALLDEFQFGQDQVDPRIIGVGEGQAEIDHQPFALGAVEIDVHANLARPAEGQEKQFFAGSHSVRAFAARRARPWMVRSGSITSNASVSLSNRMARPPVAMTLHRTTDLGLQPRHQPLDHRDIAPIDADQHLRLGRARR